MYNNLDDKQKTELWSNMMSFMEEVVMSIKVNTPCIEIRENTLENSLRKSKTLEKSEKQFFKKNLTLIPEIIEESMESDEK